MSAASDATDAASIIDAINRSTIERALANGLTVGAVQYVSTKTKEIPVISEAQSGPSGKNAVQDAVVMAGASLATDAIGLGVAQQLNISGQNAAIMSDAVLYAAGEYFFLGRKKVFRNLIVGAGASYLGGMLATGYTNAIIDNLVPPSTTGPGASRSSVPTRRKTELMKASPPSVDFSSTGF